MKGSLAVHARMHRVRERLRQFCLVYRLSNERLLNQIDHIEYDERNNKYDNLICEMSPFAETEFLRLFGKLSKTIANSSTANS